MERTVLTQDIKEIIDQNRKILDMNEKLIDFMSKSPPLISTHLNNDSFMEAVGKNPPGEAF